MLKTKLVRKLGNIKQMIANHST